MRQEPSVYSFIQLGDFIAKESIYFLLDYLANSAWYHTWGTIFGKPQYRLMDAKRKREHELRQAVLLKRNAYPSYCISLVCCHKERLTDNRLGAFISINRVSSVLPNLSTYLSSPLRTVLDQYHLPYKVAKQIPPPGPSAKIY